MGMTQEELAEKMFTTKMTISHYENNLTDIKGSVIVELADLLGTTTGPAAQYKFAVTTVATSA